MGIELAKAFVLVRADASKLPGDFRKAEGPIRAGVGRLAGILGGALAGAAGLGAFVSLTKQSIGLAERQIQAEARVAAVIKATGGAAGFTAEELKKMASSMQKSTTFGDEEILESMAILGTFKNVTGDVFKRAIASAQDLSAAGFGPLKGVTQQMAKALEDPAKGLTALTRSGVTFSKQQKEQIKLLMESGNLLGAQEILLKAVESQSKGTAEALAKTPAGKLQQTKNALGDLKEEFGKKMIPLVTLFTQAQMRMMEVLNSVVDVVSRVIGKLSEYNKATGGALVTVAKFAAAFAGIVLIGPRVIAVIRMIAVTTSGQLVGAMKGAVLWIVSAVTSMKAFVTTSVGMRAAIAAIGAAMKAALIGTGVGILLVGLGMAVVGIIKLVKMLGAMKSVQDALAAASVKLTAAWNIFKDAVLIMADAAIKAIASLVKVIAESLGIEIEKLPETVADAVTFIIDAFANFALTAASVFSAIVQNWSTTWELMKTTAALGLVIIADKFLSIWNIIKTSAKSAMVFVGTLIFTTAKNIVTAFEASGRAIKGLFQGLWAGIKSKFSGGEFMSAFKDEFNSEMAKVQGSFDSAFKTAGEAAGNTFAEGMAQESPLAGVRKELEDEQKKLLDILGKAASDIKIEALTPPKELKGGTIGSKPKEEEKKKPPAPVVPPLLSIEPGRIGFAELGKKFQDAALKEKDPLVSIGEKGNKIQDEMLQQQKKTNEILNENKDKPSPMVLS